MATSFFYIYVMATSFFYIYIYIYVYIYIYIYIYIYKWTERPVVLLNAIFKMLFDSHAKKTCNFVSWMYVVIDCVRKYWKPLWHT